MLTPWKKNYDQPRQHIKKQRHYFVNKGLSSQGYGFSSSHVWNWELDYKETECQRIDAFELWCRRRLLKVWWTARRSNQSILRNKPWLLTGRTDAETEALILWPPDVKSWLIGKDTDAAKDTDAGKYWGPEKKRATEDETVGWHHWLNGHELEQTLEDGEGQVSLAWVVMSWVVMSRTRLCNWTATNNSNNPHPSLAAPNVQHINRMIAKGQAVAYSIIKNFFGPCH